ncbi:MAG: T9SS type A sorting domain-containing protein [Sphingobacteriales bacterium]|nr:MAG: T9SS type A sorting domain-containing protein [Sphingobacteriales bacterium]
MNANTGLTLGIVMLFSTFVLQAQTSFVYYNKTYGGNDTINILAQAVQQVEDGVLVFGNYGTNTIPYGLYCMKTDALGNFQWIKKLDETPTFQQMGISVGTQVIRVQDNIILMYGKQKNIYVLKLDFGGNVIWQSQFEVITWQAGHMIINTIDEGFLIGGLEQNTTADTVKAYALKIDSEGNFEWDKRYLMGNDARFFTVQHTPWDGGYIFGGMGYSTITGYDMFVVKTAANGDTLWTKRYGNELNDCAAQVINLTSYEDWLAGQEPDYLMTGCFKEGITKKLYLAVIDGNGIIKWEKKHGFLPDISSFQALPIIKPDKGFIGSGYYLHNGFIPQPYVAAFHADGNLNWVVTPTVNPEKQVYLRDLQPTPDGGYILAGYQYSSPQTAWVLKIDSLGNTCSFIGCDSTVVVEVLPGIPSNTNTKVSAMVYPVPASTHLFIRYQIPVGISPSGGAVWRLYDALGRQVAEETLQGSTGTEQVPVEHLLAGIYYYRVVFPASGQTLASGKVMVSE